MVTAKDEDYDPSKVPALKLWGHIMQKGWQAGSVVGSLGVGPGMGAYATFVKKGQFDVLQLTEGAAYGVLGGLALTGTLNALALHLFSRPHSCVRCLHCIPPQPLHVVLSIRKPCVRPYESFPSRGVLENSPSVRKPNGLSLCRRCWGPEDPSDGS